MTYREKFRITHPNGNADLIHIFRCPKDPKTGNPVDCVQNGVQGCRACWDREIPDEKES